MSRRLAIVPARGGSKRIPKKNIKDFNGRPMITYILETAQKSKLFDVIHVSTEDPEIVHVVENFGLRVDFLRPENLSGDYTPLVPVLKHVLETYAGIGLTFEEVWLLMACSPLLETNDLIDAAELYGSQQGVKKGVLAVTEYPVPVEWAFTMTSDLLLQPLDIEKQALRSQDIETKYFDSGTFIVFPVQQVLEAESQAKDSKYLGYILPKLKGIDIDNEDDWKFAEMVHKIRSQIATTR